VDARVQEVVVFLIVAAILGLGGWRTRQLVVEQAGAARERNNLARHFPPNIVDRLAERDQPLGQVRSQKVAVMFIDIVGFTQFASRHTPDEVVAFLRDFHRRMEQAVFQHQGTLDKFLGDGLMATFGTPEPGPSDALNALNCAREMMQVMDEWNRQRTQTGEETIRLSIGVHYGDVVVGDVGSERRLEFAVLGDTVNVASRLEALTRALGVHTILSDDLVRAVNGAGTATDGTGTNDALNGFRCGERQQLRGRDAPVLVWMDGGAAAPAPDPV
jgi:adenylate cyclase